VISTGDNFYESGLTGPDDTQFSTSFSEIYTQESLQTTWYSGAAAKVSTSLFCVQNVVIQDTCRCVQFWAVQNLVCCCFAKVLYCKMHLLRELLKICVNELLLWVCILSVGQSWLSWQCNSATRQGTHSPWLPLVLQQHIPTEMGTWLVRSRLALGSTKLL
jgi:hypothetical protein